MTAPKPQPTPYNIPYHTQSSGIDWPTAIETELFL